MKIVAITASAFREQHKSILKAGCNEVVHKPFRTHEIFDCMEQQLGVRYHYAEQTVEKRAPEKIATIESAALRKLPADLLRRLADSARELDTEGVLDHLDEVTVHDPNLASLLRNYVKRFELYIVLTALTKIENNQKMKNG